MKSLTTGSRVADSWATWSGGGVERLYRGNGEKQQSEGLRNVMHNRRKVRGWKADVSMD